MHSYKWYSNINWGPFYDPETGAHYASATDIESLMCVRGGPRDMQTVLVCTHHKDPTMRWRWASEVPVHLGGYAKHWHGESI